MEYKKDFKIKPKEVRKDGSVLFTDGTNNVLPNQLACEAYGYKYDTETGTCVSFKPTIQLDKQLKEPSNTIKGVNNITNKGTSRSIINGTLNTTKGFNENCFINGTSNTINNGINNATITGTYGKSKHTGELTIGGGSFNSVAGERQYSIVQVSNKAEGNDKTLYIEGDTVNENEITLPNNSITMYEVFVSGLCTGGSSGTLGHYKCEHHTGSVLSDDDGILTKVAYATEAISSSGTTGVVALKVSTNGIFSIQVTGTANVNAEWHAVVKLYSLHSSRIEI